MWIPKREPWRSIGKCLILPIPYLKRLHVLLAPGQHWRDRIDDKVLVGGNLFVWHVGQIAREGVTGVITLCDEYRDPEERLRAAGIRYLPLPTVDRTPPSPEDVERALAFLAEIHAGGGAAYIHCASGIGRSVTLASCWLIRAKGMTVEQALTHIKAHRKQADPTQSQVEFLKRFASTAGGS